MSFNSSGTKYGFYDHYQELDRADWDSNNAMTDYVTNEFLSGFATKDPQADRFSFNFMGYSGDFYLNHKGEWQVISEDEIKVEFDEITGFLKAHELRSSIADPMPNSASNGSDRYFNKFTLVTPDGTRYEFGGINATEYSVPYRAQGARVVPDSWYLTKITTTTGNEITFTYEADDPIYSLTRTYNRIRFGQDSNGWLDNECDNVNGGHIFSGILNMPVYLKSIDYDGGRIVFNRSDSQELDYHTTDYFHNS